MEPAAAVAGRSGRVPGSFLLSVETKRIAGAADVCCVSRRGPNKCIAPGRVDTVFFARQPQGAGKCLFWRRAWRVVVVEYGYKHPLERRSASNYVWTRIGFRRNCWIGMRQPPHWKQGPALIRSGLYRKLNEKRRHLKSRNSVIFPSPSLRGNRTPAQNGSAPSNSLPLVWLSGSSCASPRC